MSNYNVAFSGLDNVSHAIDTVSNNIANANTVGYKAGQWVFADQFMKAASSTDVARAGMGAQNLSVRRPMIQGTLTTSANPLDLAISGKGMFRLLSPAGIATDVGTSRVDPAALYYTRNGQFSVNKEGYIVNENGMYLTGFQTTLEGTLTDDIYGRGKQAGRIMMPEANLVGNKTSSSALSVILDSTEKAFTNNPNIEFNPNDNATFNHKTTQTIFDTEGNPHTMQVFYRRVEDEQMVIKAEQAGYSYAASLSAVTQATPTASTKVVLNAQSLIRVDSDSKNKGLAGTQSADKTLLPVTLSTPWSADVGPSAGDRIYVNGLDTNIRVQSWDGATSKVTMTSALDIPKDAAISFYPPVKMGHTRADIAAGTSTFDFDMSSVFSPGLTPSATEHMYVNGVDTGITVQSFTPVNGATPASITTNKALDFKLKATDEVTFYAAGKRPLNMTFITPAGTEIPVVGISNAFGKDQLLATTSSHVEVYASVDDKSLNKDMDTDYYSSPKITPDPVNSAGYKAVAEIRFMGGKNIDALELDPQSGNPKYKTMTKLTTLIQNSGGGKANLVYDLDLTDTSLQSSAFQVTKSVQDGQPMSKLSDVTVDSQGRIAGVYGNGKVRYVGQIALVHFDAFEQLAPVGKNSFAATVSSGTEDTAEGVLVGHPGTGEFGEIKSQSLESSNVDLSSELVRLMILQRTYSANSQSMKAVDQVMRDTLQMIT